MIDDLHALKTQLEEFEEDWSERKVNDFEKWKETVLEQLTGQNKVRFRKLSFYEDVESEFSDFDDDIPF